MAVKAAGQRRLDRNGLARSRSLQSRTATFKGSPRRRPERGRILAPLAIEVAVDRDFSSVAAAADSTRGVEVVFAWGGLAWLERIKTPPAPGPTK